MRDSSFKTTASVFLTVLLVSAACAAQQVAVQELKPERISAFLSGVPIQKKERFRIIDFRIGRLSVKHLFLEAPDSRPTGLRYYLGSEEQYAIRSRNQQTLAELRKIVLTLPENDAVLEVDLVDDADTFYRSLAGFLGAPSFQILRIPLRIGPTTPCEEINLIVYRRISSEIDRRLEGETADPLDLDYLFSNLLSGEIEPYIDKLDTPDRDSYNRCRREFHLIKWITNKDADKFKFESYALDQDLKEVLHSLADLLSTMKWDRHRFTIDIVGFTDPKAFLFIKQDGIAVDVAAAGLGAGVWRGIPSPLSVFYEGCSGDRPSGQPVLMNLLESSGTAVGREIRDNCELGAVRAYVASVFLRHLLGSAGIAYRYGTGGIFSPQDEELADDRKRKVRIQITVNAAERRPSVEVGLPPG